MRFGVLRGVWSEQQPILRWTIAFGLTVLLSLLPPLLREDWQAVWGPYHFQLNRPVFGWTIYDYVVPRRLAENDLPGRLFRLGLPLATILLLSSFPVPSLTSLLRRCAVVLIVFVSLSVFFSPQWILWLLPFLLPLAGQQRSLLILMVAFDVCTYTLWPAQPEWDVLVGVLVYARFALLALMLVVLLKAEWRRSASPLALAPAARVPA